MRRKRRNRGNAQNKNRGNKRYKRNREYIFSLNLKKNGCYKCEECGKAPLYRNKSGESVMRPDLLTCDHIVDLALGGSNEIENLRAVCNECNNFKSNPPTHLYYDVS